MSTQLDLKWMFLIEKISLNGEILRSWLDTTSEACERHVNFEFTQISKGKWGRFIKKIENTSPQDCKAITIMIKDNLGNTRVSAIPICLALGESVKLEGYVDVPYPTEGVN
jgi:hypothetical protein